MVDKYEKEDLYKDLRLVNHKIRNMKKIGMFSETHKFIREVNQFYVDSEKIEFDDFKTSEDPDVKYAYFEYRMYKAWEKSITAGRFEV